jgi:hypothetical protein
MLTHVCMKKLSRKASWALFHQIQIDVNDSQGAGPWMLKGLSSRVSQLSFQIQRLTALSLKDERFTLPAL